MILKVLSRKAFGPGAIIALIAASIFGFPWEERPMGEPADLTWVVEILGLKVQHPLLLFLFIGFGLGFYVFPLLIEWASRRRNYDKFYESLQGIGQDVDTLFTYLERAYHSYIKGNIQEFPPDVRLFIDKASFPNWVLGAENLRIGFLDMEAGPDNRFWSFCIAIYNDIRSSQNKTAPTQFLKEEECSEIHRVRQKLEYFWEKTGRQIFETKELRYKAINADMVNQERILKLLCYLSVVNNWEFKMEGPGPQNMYRLTKKLIKTKERQYRRVARQCSRILERAGLREASSGNGRTTNGAR